MNFKGQDLNRPLLNLKLYVLQNDFFNLNLKILGKYDNNILGVTFLILTVLYTNSYFAQGIDRTTEYSIPTPNAAEILKHSIYPVNLYTGIPEISLPLTSLDFDGKTVAINLKYHAGGIKTSQEATWSGLGWSLSGIPVITRRINQKSDIGTGKLNRQPYYSGYCYDNYAVPNTIVANSTYENYLNNYGGPFFDKADTQPDVFNVTLLDETVKFQLTQKVTTSTIDAVILNDSRAKVTFNEGSRDFIVIDDDGYTYYFTHKEYVSNISAINAQNGLSNDVFKSFTSQNSAYANSRDVFIITSWYVDRIVSPNGKILNYNYKGDNSELYNSNGKEDFYVSHGPTIVAETNPFAKCHPWSNNNYLNIQSGVSTVYGYQRSLQENKFLREIIDESTGERIIFKSNNKRKDILSFDPQQNSGVDLIYGLFDNIKEPQRLYEVEKYSMNGEKSDKIKFEQSYFNSSYENTSNQDNFLRLKLDKVNINGSVYSFQYEQPDALPAKTTAGFDFWGFYNGQNTSKRFPKFILKSGMPIGKCEDNLSWTYPSGYQVNGGNKGSNFNYAKIGVLKKITYPTNGYSEFIYESNTARVNSLPSYGENGIYQSKYLENNLLDGSPISHSSNSNIKTYKVGGLRIFQILMRESAIEQLLKKEFRYEDSYGSSVPMSSGLLMDDLFYYYPIEAINTSISGYVGTTIIASSFNKVYTNGSAHGNHIGYDRVQERSYDENGIGNGEILNYFKNKPNVVLNTNTNPPEYPLDAPPLTFEEGNGKLLKKQLFDNSSSTPVKEIINNYNDIQVDVSNGLKIYYSDMNVQMYLDGGYTNGATSEIYEWYNYKTRQTYSLLSSTITKDYFPSGTVENLTNYYYDSKPQLKIKRVTLPTNEIVETKYYYPYDTEYGVNSLANMADLINENRISRPVYLRHLRDNNLLSHELVKYGVFNNLTLPTSIHFQKEDNSLSNIEERINYHVYDNYGNVEKVSTNGGPVTQYIWGYEKKFPVAKVENLASNATPFQNIINEDIVFNSRSSSSAITGEVDKIRNNSTYSNSMVTGYAYKPGVGMNEISDSRNKKSSFEYDNSHRLLRTKDDEGNIVTEQKYYQVNEEDCTDCDPTINLNSNYYSRSINQSFSISRVLPSGIGTIQRWELDRGDGSIEHGNGTPPSSFTLSYSTTGLKPIRLFAIFNDGSFITGNVNIRVK